jgi:hypothetical protein
LGSELRVKGVCLLPKWTPIAVNVRPDCIEIDMDVKQLKTLTAERICGRGTIPASFSIIFTLFMVYLITLSVVHAVQYQMIS